MIGNEQIQGYVYFPPGDQAGVRPVIKLQSLSSPELTTVTDPDGSFRFTHLRPDAYTVIVDAGDAYERVRETVVIAFAGSVPAQGDPGQYAIPFVYPIQIYLKPKNANASNAALANVPAPAQDLFRQAQDSARAGNHAQAIEQLKSAIAVAPKFARAYNELAMEYRKQGQEAQALETLKAGVGNVPDDPTLRLNYGIALLNLKKFVAAETELRLASQQNNGDSPRAGYYVGRALMGQNRLDDAQAVFETVIKNGGDNLAAVHKYLGGIYWHNKQYRQAADELEKYLKLEPKAADAAQIRNTIGELRHKT
jgi:tetratricopeptide (TPR) repeat protein